MRAYDAFLKGKRIFTAPSGFDVQPHRINSKLFDFQRDVVKWATKKGKCAIFEDCGLGKSCQELEWSQHVTQKTNKPILNCAPLAVSLQTQREGQKFDIGVNVAREHAEVLPGVNITNYEMLSNFDPREFGGIVLDESSILKGDGPLRKRITDFALHIPYRLAGTATPAPNDHMELGNHAEFLGIMSKTEMLSTRFFEFSNNGQRKTHQEIREHIAAMDDAEAALLRCGMRLIRQQASPRRAK